MLRLLLSKLLFVFGILCNTTSTRDHVVVAVAASSSLLSIATVHSVASARAGRVVTSKTRHRCHQEAFWQVRHAAAGRCRLRLLPLALWSTSTDFSTSLQLSRAFLTLTVPETNTLLVPILASSAFSFGAWIYFLNCLPMFPKGAVVGLGWVYFIGLWAGPAELLTQQLYGVSFFDCDWIHGTISALFATGYSVANLSLLQFLRIVNKYDGDTGGWSSGTNINNSSANEVRGPTSPPSQPDGDGYDTALTYCVFAATVILGLAASEYGNDYPVHAPHWYGVLESVALHRLPMVMTLFQEPANALSVATWWVHIVEITQFQMFMRLTWRWVEQQQQEQQQRDLLSQVAGNAGSPEWTSFLPSSSSRPQPLHFMPWSLVPLQWSNVCIISFHLLYNQVAPLYLSFGLLLLVGNTLAALTVWWQLQLPQHRRFSADVIGSSATSAGTMFSEMSSSSSSSSLPTRDAVSIKSTNNTQCIVPTTTTGNSSSRVIVDTPIAYTTKSLVIGLIAAHVVKYGSLWIQLPAHVNVVTAAVVTLPVMLYCVWDIYRLDQDVASGFSSLPPPQQ